MTTWRGRATRQEQHESVTAALNTPHSSTYHEPLVPLHLSTAISRANQRRPALELTRTSHQKLVTRPADHLRQQQLAGLLCRHVGADRLPGFLHDEGNVERVALAAAEPVAMVGEHRDRRCSEGPVPLHVRHDVADEPIDISQLTPVCIVGRRSQR